MLIWRYVSHCYCLLSLLLLPTFVQADDAAYALNDEQIHSLIQLTQHSFAGDSKAALELGRWYQNHKQPIAAENLAYIWFASLTPFIPEAEQGYEHLLEQRFNQQRARQIAKFKQLEQQEIEPIQPSSSSIAPKIALTKPQPSYRAELLFVFAVLVNACALFFIYRRANKTPPNTPKVSSSTLAAMTKKIMTQTQQLQQQQQQIEQLQQELLLNARSMPNQDYALACALLGFAAHDKLTLTGLKKRYKQLSLLYHPDKQGNDEQMKRLNHAFIQLEKQLNSQ